MQSSELPFLRSLKNIYIITFKYMYVYLKQNIFLDLFYRILRSVLEHLKTCLDNCNNIIVSYLFVCLGLASDFQYLSIEVQFFSLP